MRALCIIFLIVDLTVGLAKNGIRKPRITDNSEKTGGCQACGGLPKPSPTGDSGFDCRSGLKDCYQPPLAVKCCDESCPKCLGGLPPAPGTNGCQFGCPEGLVCPGECPCDACVCCYTITKLSTTTSTCLDSTTIQVIQLATSTEAKFETTITTLTRKATFTVYDIFSFTSVTTETTYPTAPVIASRNITEFETTASTVFASTVTEVGIGVFFTSTTPVTQFVPAVSYIPDPTSTDFIVESVLVVDVLVTSIPSFIFVPTRYAGTSELPGGTTAYEFIYPLDTLTVPTTSIPTFKVITSPVSATTTLCQLETITPSVTEYIPTTTQTQTYTPTTTIFTTPCVPPPMDLPFFPV